MSLPRCHPVPVLAVGALTFIGCASAQRIRVETDPIGAQVYLQLRGDLEVQARVAGVVGGAELESFEEDWFLLGTSPVDYEFERRETEAAVHSPDAGGSVTRHYREGTLRIELEGFETAVRVVRFAGDDVVWIVRLRPSAGPTR